MLRDIHAIHLRLSKVVAKVLTLPDAWTQLSGIYNMGGPERLSRVDMAHALAEVYVTVCCMFTCKAVHLFEACHVIVSFPGSWL